MGRKAMMLFALLACAAACPDAREHLRLASAAGKAPFVVRITGPTRLVRLSTGRFQGRTGCGYFVLWGDGPYSSSPTGPTGSDCAEGLQHTFTEPGSYVVRATIYRLGPADESIDEWSDSAVVTVSQ